MTKAKERVPALEGRCLTKTYGKVTVVKDIDIAVGCGRIRAVVGENGAGKSTLMKMLTGIIEPTAGSIYVQGEPVVLGSPGEANDKGIGIVHQELQLVPMLSVADNLMLVGPKGAPKTLRGVAAEQQYVEKQLERVGLDVSPRAVVSTLSAAEAQLLEIAKALALDVKILIFDEPTSALPPADADRLLDLIEGLKNNGNAILYISHHLSEIMRLADDVSVLRDGSLVGDLRRGEFEAENLIHLMVDRPVSLYANKRAPMGEKIVMQAWGLGTEEVEDINFELRAGEVLGFAGLIGSGMHDAALAICGDDKITEGTIRIHDKQVSFRSPAEAARHGVVFVPEERKLQGILPELNVHDNFHVGRFWRFAKSGFLNTSRLSSRAEELVRRFKVRLHGMDQAIQTLSGGNQQKVVVARCVQDNPKVLILSEPTRGVDVGAKDDIHQMILELASQGTSIIIVSSELDEVLALSHNVAVFSAGRMVGVLENGLATPTTVMTLATPKKQRMRENEYAN